MTTTAEFTGTVFRSRWPELEIPPMSLPQFLLGSAAGRGDRPALIDGPTGRVTSYGQFAVLVRRAAAGFAAHGLRKGQVAAALWLLSLPVVPGVGQLLPGVQARLVDTAAGTDVDADQAGELWLRSPAAMAGYLNDRSTTAATMDQDTR
jgi:acyl-CoA synthetase (AMP-forming)/AMP-acid ligase II